MLIEAAPMPFAYLCAPSFDAAGIKPGAFQFPPYDLVRHAKLFGQILKGATFATEFNNALDFLR